MIIKYDSMINPVVMELYDLPRTGRLPRRRKVLPSWEPRLELIKGNLLPMWSHCSWGPAIYCAVPVDQNCWNSGYWIIQVFFFSIFIHVPIFLSKKAILIFDLEEITINHEKSIPCSSFSLVKSSHFPIDPTLKKKWMTLWLYDYHLVI